MRRQLSGGDQSDAVVVVVVVGSEVTRETYYTWPSQVDPLMLFVFRAPDTVGHERRVDSRHLLSSWCCVFSSKLCARPRVRACVQCVRTRTPACL